MTMVLFGASTIGVQMSITGSATFINICYEHVQVCKLHCPDCVHDVAVPYRQMACSAWCSVVSEEIRPPGFCCTPTWV